MKEEMTAEGVVMAPTAKHFTYETNCRWTRGRSGMMGAGQKPALSVSSPPEFKGDPSMWSPEELLVAAVESCTMAAFLAYAERWELPVEGYFSTAEGRMEWTGESYRFTGITVRPTIVIGPEASREEAFEVLKLAKQHCFIGNSLVASVKFEPAVETIGISPEVMLASSLP